MGLQRASHGKRITRRPASAKRSPLNHPPDLGVSPHSPWPSPHSRRLRPRWGERPLSPGTARDAAAA